MKSFIITTIVDLVVFILGYYSLFVVDEINIRILIMAIVLLICNRVMIWSIKRDIQSKKDEIKIAIPLPLNTEHNLKEIILPTFDLSRPTLFLELNGVLYRNASRTMEHKALFMTLFDDHPNLQIIISSTIRTDCTESWLKSKLGDDLFEKVTGYTPVSTSQSKKDEITLFLSANPLNNAVVVVDNEDHDISDDMEVMMIKTEYYKGLTPEIVKDISVAVSNGGSRLQGLAL